jgi:pyruvate-formate lyase-activating enzyme
MAGKPKGSPSKKLNPLALRVTDELLADLKEMAANEHRALANMAVALILEAIAERKRRAGAA